jgi:hypothetical protein
MAKDALAAVGDLTRRNLALWEQMQGAWFRGDKDPETEEDRPPPGVTKNKKGRGSRPRP